ncbi:MAG: SRPBCC family protein [Chloroflexi bacterium]|nr:SRPBCC family protein [Chloroflexota bacterium]
MIIDASAFIRRPPDDIYRIVSDMKYVLEAIDPDVVSVEKTSDGPIGIGTTWTETLRAPLMTMLGHLELTGFDPGRSIIFSFTASHGVSGTGTITCAPNGDGANFSIRIHATTHGIGCLLYPMIRIDFIRRERKRVKNLKRLAESGELDPKTAEAAPGLASTGSVRSPSLQNN